MRFSEGLAAGGDLGAQLIHQVISVFQTVPIPVTTRNHQTTCAWRIVILLKISEA
jgi:hypothetical protein